jgi:tight adherence protein B
VAAWTLLAEGSSDEVLRGAARAAADGDAVASAIARSAALEPIAVRSAWRGLAAAWLVSTEAGAPLAGCLRDLASAFRAIGETERDLDVALAGPRATARMVMALPAVGVLFGFALGFNTLQTLFATAPGLVLLVVGSGLMVLGAVWNRRMLRRATPKDRTPGLPVDLMAIAMSGGGSIDGARELVAEARRRFDLSGSDAVEAVIDLSKRAGVPAAELLRSEAEQLRRQARSDGQRVAAALAVRLMLPLGVCVLPAFMVLGVAPLLVSILSSTVAVL